MQLNQWDIRLTKSHYCIQRILCLLFLFFLLSKESQSQESIKIPEVYIYGEQDLKEATQHQSVDSLLLVDPSNKDLGAGLQKLSHAFVKSYGIGSLATVSLRGSGSNHTNLNWNGANLNSASNSIVDFSLIPPFFTEDVSVAYGQSSLQYGAGGLGGAVQMTNPIDFSKKEEILFQQDLGSFNYHSSALKLKMGKHKLRSVSRLLYKGAINNFQYKDLSEEGFPSQSLENAELEQKGLLQSLHYRPNEKQRLDLHFWYFDSERELPNMMSLRDLEESQYDENIRLQLGFHQYLKKAKLSFNSTLLRDQVVYRNNQLKEENRSLNKSLRNYMKAEIDWRKIHLNARLDIDYDQAEQLAYSGGHTERNRQALFIEASSSLSNSLSLSLSGRQELIEEDSYFLPQARLDYRLKEQKINFCLMIGQNMKYPSLNDLYWSVGGNPHLIAEQSKSIEFGQLYQWELSHSRIIQLKLNTFYSLIEDYIQWAPTNLGFWRAENLKKVESKGLEIDLNTQFNGKISQQYGIIYNYVNSINLEKNGVDDQSHGKQLIYVPEHQYNFNARWQLKSISLQANWQFVSARYLRSDNSDFLPYYNLVDLSLGKDWKLGKDRLSASISVQNLLDADYQAIQWRPMPGRNYMISLKYLIKK